MIDPLNNFFSTFLGKNWKIWKILCTYLYTNSSKNKIKNILKIISYNENDNINIVKIVSIYTVFGFGITIKNKSCLETNSYGCISNIVNI